MAASTAFAAPWPDGVNFYAYRNSYNEQLERNVLEFKPDVGPEKRRRRMSQSTELIQFSSRFTAAEWAAVKVLYRQTLADGVLPFLATNPVTMTTDTWSFIDAPKVTEARVIHFVVSISLRWLASEILFDPIGDGSSFDIGDGINSLRAN